MRLQIRYMGDHHRSMITQEAAPLVLKECADIDRLIAPFLIKAFHRFKEHLDSLAGSVAYRYVLGPSVEFWGIERTSTSQFPFSSGFSLLIFTAAFILSMIFWGVI